MISKYFSELESIKVQQDSEEWIYKILKKSDF